LLAPGTDPELLARVQEDFADKTTRASQAFDSIVEIQCRRKDGREFWAAVFISPVRDSSGKLMQHFISVHDQTKHRQEQAQCEMLIGELNHRVKNTLSTVQAIVAQSLRSSSDPAVISESIQSRVFALARSHDLLTEVDWRDTGLRDLVERSLEPFVQNGRAQRLVISGDNVRLPPKTTLALGIAFHELAMNAVEFGAFMDGIGLVTIDWKTEQHSGESRLILCWRETEGPPVTSPSRKGFGSAVIGRGLPHELHGTVKIEYLPGGLVCTINIPAPHNAHLE
jgi:two-component sensor histidine kinase